VRLFGVDPQRQPDRAAELIGIQLQDSALPDRIKTWEALHLFTTLGRRQRRRTGSTAHLTVTEALAQWGLEAKRHATFASLSGGQRQRLLVSLALVNRPRLVFLDEMTTGLDPAARHEAWQVIEQVRQQGTTVVLVTHFMDEAERLCDRICVMSGGRVVASGSPEGLRSRHGGDTLVRFRIPERTDPPYPWERLPGLTGARYRDGLVELRGTGGFLTALGAALTSAGLPDTELLVDRPRLEDVYLRLVGPGPAGDGPDPAEAACR
jgi:ABC-2 type transport system ATP-binding protein